MGLTAIVLAGDRGEESALLRESGASCKALVPVAGRPMVLRVLEALRTAARVDEVLLCGPKRAFVDSCPELRAHVISGDVRWIEGGDTPCRSVLAGLAEVTDDAPVLVTTADHALLTADIIDRFLDEAAATDADLVCAVARHERVQSAFPETRRTAHRLRDGGWCGCNLFRLGGKQARRGVEFWRRIEALRKRPWRAARLIGWSFLLQYATRRITLAQALEQVAQRMGCSVGSVTLETPTAAVDVDSVADWRLVEAHLESATD